MIHRNLLGAISDVDFLEINRANEPLFTLKCWVCQTPNYAGTAFCKVHFSEWQKLYHSEKIDICSFSYAHHDYKGARLHGFGTRQLVRDWLACYSSSTQFGKPD